MIMKERFRTLVTYSLLMISLILFMGLIVFYHPDKYIIHTGVYLIEWHNMYHRDEQWKELIFSSMM